MTEKKSSSSFIFEDHKDKRVQALRKGTLVFVARKNEQGEMIIEAKSVFSAKENRWVAIQPQAVVLFAKQGEMKVSDQVLELAEELTKNI